MPRPDFAVSLSLSLFVITFSCSADAWQPPVLSAFAPSFSRTQMQSGSHQLAGLGLCEQRRLPARVPLPVCRKDRSSGQLAMCADVDAEPIMIGDVVEYTSGGVCTVGVVEEESGEAVRVMPLVRREGMGEECYADETQPVVSLPKIECRFVNTYPQQRVAWSLDSPHHNPHGEESEDCWIIEDTLSDSCFIAIKHISDT